jgi:hypothetical protein
MERLPGFLGVDSDVIGKYRDSYLRLRGLKTPSEDAWEQMFDSLPEILALG